MLSHCFIRSTTLRLNSFGYLPTRLFPTSQLLSAKVCLKRLSQSRGSVQFFAFQAAGFETALTRLLSNHNEADPSRSEPAPVFNRVQERLDHLGLNVIAIELVQFVQPEVVTVEVAIGSIVGASPQVSEVLHQHERAVEFLLGQR